MVIQAPSLPRPTKNASPTGEPSRRWPAYDRARKPRRCNVRVLLAVDGSAAANQAVELATGIHWPAVTELRVVCVVEPLDVVIAAAWGLPGSSESEGYA